jgi:hypothetical protein
VVTCSVCRDQHFHRHCMPMGRVAMAENQSWRCWHCACECLPVRRTPVPCMQSL